MAPDWKTHGIRIVRAAELHSNTPQTPGMTRAVAISRASSGRRHSHPRLPRPAHRSHCRPAQ